MTSSLLQAVAEVARLAGDVANAYFRAGVAVARKGDGAPTGTHLLRALPGQYAALAVSFFEGGFLAQLPNDPGDRLQMFQLPPADGESLDAVLAAMALGDVIATWPEGSGPGLPAWLARPQPMHWIGALYAADTLPPQASRAHDLVGWFDGVAFLRNVDAETSDEIGKNRAP